jgi:hypothetical protein
MVTGPKQTHFALAPLKRDIATKTHNLITAEDDVPVNFTHLGQYAYTSGNRIFEKKKDWKGQVVLTLNLLRQSHVAPNISVYSYHHGTFDYNRMPLAPMGCAVQFHFKPNRRKTWGEHSSDGWYLTTSKDHFRCQYIFVKATRAKHISDTVYFKHKHITQPSLTTEDLVIKSIQDLYNAFKGGKNLKNDKTQIEAITRLTNALRPGNKLPLQ